LALRLGKSVKECQQQIDSAEFSEWIAFNNIYPFIIDRAEYSTAVLASLTANIHSKNGNYTHEDFLLQKERKIQSGETIAATLGALYGSNK